MQEREYHTLILSRSHAPSCYANMHNDVCFAHMVMSLWLCILSFTAVHCKYETPSPPLLYTLGIIIMKCWRHHNLFCSPDQILSVENVFTVLNKVAKGWRWVAEEILLISSSTCKEIEDVYITQEKCLQQAITFWFQRYVFASWRFLLVWLDDKGEEEVSREVRQASESESIPGKIKRLAY